MINYTERLTLLMEDIVRRVPTLSFLDMADVLVFARAGRSNAEGAFATCHCLTLPASEPGYYFWRDRATNRITRRSEWFVTKSPTVTLGTRQIKYMLSFTLPRFCDQSLDRSRKEKFYGSAISRSTDRAKRSSIPAPTRGLPSSTPSFTSCITSIPSWPVSGGSSAKTGPTPPTATGTASSNKWQAWSIRT